MSWRSQRLGAVVANALLCAACVQTSRVDDSLTTASLGGSGKAVAIMRVGAASPSCMHVAVLLGVRDGDLFRRYRGLTVMNVRSSTEPAVAEVELDPGEYHVVAYRCQTERGVRTVQDGAEPGVYRTSFASFRVEPGEIVNVGYLHVAAWRRGYNMFGRPVTMEVDVSDWPLGELELYKARRPHMFAQMKTRLMTAAPQGHEMPTGQDCARLETLKREGKVQQLPDECAKPAKKRRASGPVAKSRASL
jgi:hypothetical protein